MLEPSSRVTIVQSPDAVAPAATASGGHTTAHFVVAVGLGRLVLVEGVKGHALAVYLGLALGGVAHGCRFAGGVARRRCEDEG